MKEIATISLWVAILFPISPPDPRTKLNSPSGISCLAIIFVSSIALAGVNDAGFRITALPHIIAGAAFQAGIATGKFQGEIIPITPKGSREIST